MTARYTLFDSPLFLGFDHFERTFDRIKKSGSEGYPPYNIEKTAQDAYRISVAVAGFDSGELNVEVKDGSLYVTARKSQEPSAATFLHRGIATRAFERRFALADHVRVTGAVHELGMLHIDLLRETPEALKPRRIEIGRGSDHETKAIEATLPELTTV